MQKEKDRQDSDVKTTGYKRTGTDKQVSTKAGTVANGVRTVSQKQATDIGEKNGLKTTNKAKGQIPSNAAPSLLPPNAIKNGVSAYAQTFRNGKQVWVYLRPDGTIFDAGVNLIPR